MGIEQEYVSKDKAKRLKTLGFDLECTGLYLNEDTVTTSGCTSGFKNNHIHYKDNAAILWQQAEEFFRNLKYQFGIAKIHDETDLYHYHINNKWRYFKGSFKEARDIMLLTKVG